MKRVALVLGVLASAGCPQLLGDGFSMQELGSAGSGGSLGDLLDNSDSGVPPLPPPDAEAMGGASGAGGAAGGAGDGGASGSVGSAGTVGSAGSAGSGGEDAGADAASDVPVPDAAPPDAGPPPCVSTPERCDGLDNDCDDQVDQGPTCAPTCRGLLILGRSYMFCGGAGAVSSTAETRCVAQSMHLVSIESPEENAAIVAAVAPLAPLSTVSEPQKSIWLAARDSAVEDTWRWGVSGPIFWQGSFGGSAQNGAYTNWSTGKPNDNGSAGEDCGVLYLVTGTEGGLGQWNDYVCAEPHAFLCERTP